jgi:site-specific DNA recombinase
MPESSEANGHGSRPERVALYLRVSSEEQRERETITIQREFLENYCDLYGLDVVETYADDGVSGTTGLHERPAGARLLEDAKVGRAFNTVLVYKLDRLGRTLLSIVDGHDRLSAAGVELRSATEPIDTTSPSGRLIFNMLAGFAQYDRENIADRTTKGLHKAYRNGKHTGAVPFGYDIAAGGSFVIVEDEARIARDIIANIAAGSTLYGEAKRLNDEGVPSPGLRFRGKPREHGAGWSIDTVRRIVRARTYSGTHEVTLGGGSEVVEREVPAIVERELQQRAIARLAENKRFSGGKKGRNYLLRGLVQCAECGIAYVGTGAYSPKTNKRYHYYVCSNRKARRYDARNEGLSCPNTNAAWLESLVWDDVRRFLHNPGEVLERVREQGAGAGSSTNELEERHADLGQRLAAKHKERDRWLHLYAQGHISDEELETNLADLRNQTDNLKLLIAAVEDDLAAEAENAALAETTAAWLTHLRERISEVEADTEEALVKRRELVKLLVERILVGRDGSGNTSVRITYRFGEPFGEPPTQEETDGFSHGELDSVRGLSTQRGERRVVC